MKSIYEEALGDKFKLLHPQLQQKFSLHSQSDMACIGRGVMSRIWHRPFFISPFLQLGAKRHILVAEQGEDVPFSIENYAYLDRFGREAVAWIRSFHFTERISRFDATMIYSKSRQIVVDYLGTHQHLAVDIELLVTEQGGLRLVSQGQRFYEGYLGVSLPKWLSAQAEVYEWYDEQKNCFQIEVNVSHKIFGQIFGYRGAFDVQFSPLHNKQIPAYVKPLREEKRE